MEYLYINSLIIMTTLIYKIPPNLPLPKGGFTPLFGKEGCGEIFWTNVNSIMRPLINPLPWREGREEGD